MRKIATKRISKREKEGEIESKTNTNKNAKIERQRERERRWSHKARKIYMKKERAREKDGER